VQLFYGGDKAIAAASERFDKARAFGRVAEGFADLVDGAVEALVEIGEGARRPKLLAELLAGDDFAGMSDEEGEDLKGLFLQLHLDAVLVELTGPRIQNEGSETDSPRRVRDRLHPRAPETTLRAV